MDPSKLRLGELLTALAAAALLGVMFLDWYGGASAWQALPILRVLLVLAVLLGLALVAVTLQRRPVAAPVAAAVLLIALGALTTVLCLARLAFPPDGADRELGAYLGVLLAALLSRAAWRVLADERTDSAHALRQAERTLAVRGAPRPVPPRRRS